MFLVGDDAFLDEAAELGVETAVFVRIGFGFAVEEFEEALGDDVPEFLDEGAVLHGFAGDIEREVIAIDDAAEEAEPFREEALGVSVDEDAAAVEGDAGFGLAHAPWFGVFLRDEDEGIDDEGGVCVEVQAVAGFVPCVGDELVEFAVLFVGDLAAVFEPEGFDGIDPVAVEEDGEWDEVRVAFEEFLSLPFAGEVGVFLAEADDDAAAAGLAGSGVDGVAGAAVAGPAEGFAIGLP